jgi:hypothetical protein
VSCGGCRLNDRVNGCRQLEHTNFNLSSAVKTCTKQDSSEGLQDLDSIPPMIRHHTQHGYQQCNACMRCAWLARKNGRTGGQWRCEIGLAAWSKWGRRLEGRRSRSSVGAVGSGVRTRSWCTCIIHIGSGGYTYGYTHVYTHASGHSFTGWTNL